MAASCRRVVSRQESAVDHGTSTPTRVLAAWRVKGPVQMRSCDCCTCYLVGSKMAGFRWIALHESSALNFNPAVFEEGVSRSTNQVFSIVSCSVSCHCCVGLHFCHADPKHSDQVLASLALEAKDRQGGVPRFHQQPRA